MSVTPKTHSDTASLGDVASDSLVRDLSDDPFIDFVVDEKFNSSVLMAEDIGRLADILESDGDAGTSGLADGPGIDSGGDDALHNDALHGDLLIDVTTATADEAPFASNSLTATHFEISFGQLSASAESDGENVEAGEGASLPDTYTSGNSAVDDSLEYNVAINFEGAGWTDDLKADFVSAGDYLSRVITGDVADINLFGEIVDDIVIRASLSEIDGIGGIVGRAAPTFIRTADSLPVAGFMEFDSADAAFLDEIGLWDDVILHEMLHTIGFGTIWNRLGLVEGDRFNGAAATEAFANEFPALYDGSGPFVETEGGAGTALGHWDEESFDDELMTGIIDSGGTYVSDMTIASLEDLGYETIYGDEILVG